MNVALNYNEPVPSLLVIEGLPCFPAGCCKVQHELEGMNKVDLKRLEMETIVVQLCLYHTLQSRFPFSATKHFKDGEEVLIFRECKQSKWIEPFKISAPTEKGILNKDGNSTAFNLQSMPLHQQYSRAL